MKTASWKGGSFGFCFIEGERLVKQATNVNGSLSEWSLSSISVREMMET